jgi:hypothetical protein
MRRRPLSLVLVALSIPVLGGISFAAAQSVSNRPEPQVVIPARSVSPNRSGHGGLDDPATHNSADDRPRVSGPSSTVAGGTTSSTASAIDANGGDGSASSSGDRQASTTSSTIDDPGRGRGSDDPASHTSADDHGGTKQASPETTSDHSGRTPSTTATTADHGSRGRDSSSSSTTSTAPIATSGRDRT